MKDQQFLQPANRSRVENRSGIPARRRARAPHASLYIPIFATALLFAGSLLLPLGQVMAQKVTSNTQTGTSTVTHADGTSVSVGKDGNITVNSPKTGTTTTVNAKDGTTSAKDNKTGATTTPVKHNPPPAGGAKGAVPQGQRPTQGQGGPRAGGQGQGQQGAQGAGQGKGLTIDVNPNGDGTVTITVTNGNQTDTIIVHPQANPQTGETTTTVTSPGDGKSTASVTTDKNGGVTNTGVTTPAPGEGQSFEVTKGPDGRMHIYTKNARGEITGDFPVPDGYDVEIGDDKIPHPVQRPETAKNNPEGGPGGNKPEQPSANPPAEKPAPKLESGEDFKPVKPQPGNGGGTGGKGRAYLPPIAGPGSTIVATVLDENDQPGTQGVILGTVDDGGKHDFYQGHTDVFGRISFALTTGLTGVDLFRQFDGRGSPDQPAHTDVGQATHLKNSEPIPQNQIPSRGPAITEANTVVERGGASNGAVTLHTQGTNPLTTHVLVDNKPVQTLASSNMSVVAQLPANTPLGTHQFSVTSDGMKSNTFPADVLSIVPEQIPPMHTGAKANVVVHVDGVPPGHQAMMHFEVSGAAKLRNGAPSTDIPVKNGLATVAIQGTHPGALEVNYQITVRGLWQ